MEPRASCVAALVLIGCGGSVGTDQTKGPSGFVSSRPSSSLGDGERIAFCDWAAAQMGGYGNIKDCGTVYVGSFLDRAQCLGLGFLDPCTVGDYETCFIAFGKQPDFCAPSARTLPECANQARCYANAHKK